MDSLKYEGQSQGSFVACVGEAFLFLSSTLYFVVWRKESFCKHCFVPPVNSRSYFCLRIILLSHYCPRVAGCRHCSHCFHSVVYILFSLSATQFLKSVVDLTFSNEINSWILSTWSYHICKIETKLLSHICLNYKHLSKCSIKILMNTWTFPVCENQ